MEKLNSGEIFLNREEQKFSDAYLDQMSIDSAIDSADNDPKTKYRTAEMLLATGNVTQHLNKQRKALAETFVTTDDILLRAYRILDVCLTPTRAKDVKGHPSGKLEVDTKGATKECDPR